MSLLGLLPELCAEPGIAAARSALDSPLVTITAPPGVRAGLLAALNQRPLLVVTATGREAEDLAATLRGYLPPDAVADFPAWETLPHERLSPRSDTVGRRLSVLRRLVHPDAGDAVMGPIQVLVAPIRAVMQPVIAGLGDLEPVRVISGQDVELEDVVRALVAAGYSRSDMIEKRGEFAVRGGILDVFPPTQDHPLRLEFWGDRVEEIRWFSVADQRSLEIAEGGLLAAPCREVLLTDEVRARADKLSTQIPGVADLLSQVAAGIAVEGMESLAPLLVERMHPLLELLAPRTHVVLLDPERIRTRAADLVTTSQEFLAASWANAAAGAGVPIDLGAELGSSAYYPLAEVRSQAGEYGLPWWGISALAVDQELLEAGDGEVVTIAVQESPAYRGDTEAALRDLRAMTHDNWRVVLCTEGPGSATRMTEVLSGADIPARLVADVASAPEPGLVLVTTSADEHGFVAPGIQLALITTADLTGTRSATRDMRKLPSRRRNVVDPLQLKPGDHVVHEQHGVGKYIEMVQRTIGGATREYLVIEYAPSKRGHPGDRLFVPSDALDQVTRYVGGEQPTLSKMGGSDWAKTKSRARKAVREIAGELIQLYSARMASVGHTFGPDTPWQAELEDAFAFVETPDQLSCIDEVKGDMEKAVPMDRLVCGDVGYGKTEIAVRAAFKAVQDGKQVAVLVPTTLLVQQHMETFVERYAPFPVKVAPLSRFSSPADAEKVKVGLAQGEIDVVIGTHRLFSGEVQFKDLGLIVVDEEQRFGVEHKERLKHLRTNVDVLSMSATPIPRTLEMAVTGIREMSILATPPEERHPILTFVGAYEEKTIAAAIRRELLREGQVFFIHNRVESVDRAAARLAELVPEARIATAHGRMGEHQLERVMVDFWEKRFDVLVSTTIVESGLNIPNANTLIVERSDVLGLSQLHQLRGRVGRGRERAYAYFLYPPERPLTETAHDRLQTIAAHTELGAGMHVAMKDLEIRGAGNLLGGEQSGHIAGVGFDLYMRMVSEAVASFRGQEPAEHTDVKIDLPVDGHLPHDYIPGERLRLEAYRKIAEILDEEGLQAVRAELQDRYGPIPQVVEHLLEVSRLRTLARAAGLREIAAAGNQVRFAPVELLDSAQLRVQRVYPGTVLRPSVKAMLVPRPTTARVGGTPLRDVEVLKWAAGVIDAVRGGTA